MKKHHIKKPDAYECRRKDSSLDDSSIIVGDELFKEWFGELPKWAVYISGYRNREGWTQKQLADLLGLHQGDISKMENGKKPIGKNVAKRMAELFKTDYRFFL